MANLTGFDVSLNGASIDLSYIFQPYSSGINQETKYIAKNGQDLSGIFQPYDANYPMAPETGFYYTSTNDLNKLFSGFDPFIILDINNTTYNRQYTNDMYTLTFSYTTPSTSYTNINFIKPIKNAKIILIGPGGLGAAFTNQIINSQRIYISPGGSGGGEIVNIQMNYNSPLYGVFSIFPGFNINGTRITGPFDASNNITCLANSGKGPTTSSSSGVPNIIGGTGGTGGGSGSFTNNFSIISTISGGNGGDGYYQINSYSTVYCCGGGGGAGGADGNPGGSSSSSGTGGTGNSSYDYGQKGNGSNGVIYPNNSSNGYTYGGGGGGGNSSSTRSFSSGYCVITFTYP